MAARTLSIGPMLVPDESAPFRLHLFGTPALCGGGVTTRLAVPAKAVALLAILVVHPGSPQLRSRLAEILWPEITDEEARANLRRHLHLLVKTLPPSALALTKNSACWNGEQLGCDVVEFSRLSSDPRTFARAVALRQGELCVGVHDDALEPERKALDERYVAMLTDLAYASYKTGRHPDARLYLERLVAADPLDERHVRALMSLSRETGDRAGALREYNVLAARLRTELDVEPERETTQLFQEILYASEAGSTPHNLTGETNSFVGREAELEEVGTRLRDHRLVTILGPAGIGKTRLARRSAFNQLGQFPGGVWFVDLAQSSSRVDIERSVAQVLRREITPTASAMPAILHALAAQPALLVLDNCEQVCIDAGEFAAALFAGSKASVLATSRHRLEASDESVLHLQPLPVPPEATHHNAEEVMRYPAARLFLERAATVAPWLRLTAENARNVGDILACIDGLPLAIELVAARANLLTLEGILKRLADRSTVFASRSHGARHFTLDDAIAWSYDLLSETERALFGRLSVFAGSFDMAAAECVCREEGLDVAATLFELVEASVLQPLANGEQVRYQMLATTRVFAQEKLRRSADAQTMARAHATYYAGVAEPLRRLDDASRERRFTELAADFDNFAAALRWCAEHGDLDVGARLANGIVLYMKQRTYSRETLTLIETLLEHADEPASERLALCHRSAGILANTCTEWPRAKKHNQLAAEIFGSIGDDAAASNAYSGVVAAEFHAGHFEQAERLLLETLQKEETLGNAAFLAKMRSFLGAVYLATGRLREAREQTMRSLETFRLLGDTYRVSVANKNLALGAFHAGDLGEAIAWIEEALALSVTRSDMARYVDAVNLHGSILRKRGLLAEALAKHSEALRVLSTIEESHLIADVLEDTAQSCTSAGDPATAALAAGAARRVRDEFLAPMNPFVAPKWDDLLARLSASLGTERFENLLSRGASTPRRQLLTEIADTVSDPLGA